MIVLSQDDAVCLPPGLDCYRKETMMMKDNCTIPCKGIYVDVVNEGVEDLHTRIDFKQVLDKYKEYKSGFVKNKGNKSFGKIEN